MNKEFFAALELLEKEKGIPREYLIEKIEAALVSAYKKEYGNNTNVRVVIDPVKEDVKLYQQKEVVEVVEDPQTQISLEAAKALSKRNTLGKIIETEVKPKNFRRLSAGAAKSVVIQGIREGERRVMQQAYESKREEIITATVSKIDPTTGNAVLETGTGYAVLLKSEQIPGEEYTVGDKIKVKFLGIDDKVGSIEVGKDADIAIFDGHPFCNFTRCKLTMIDGVVYHNTL